MAEENSQILADSMMGMYGKDAVQAAKEYASKHLRSGDSKNHAVWLHVAEILEKQIAERDS